MVKFLIINKIRITCFVSSLPCAYFFITSHLSMTDNFFIRFSLFLKVNSKWTAHVFKAGFIMLI